MNNSRFMLFFTLAGLEDYIPVMSEAELRLLFCGELTIDHESIERWEILLQQSHLRETSSRIEKAYAEQR